MPCCLPHNHPSVCNVRRSPQPQPPHLHAHEVGCDAQDEPHLAALVHLQRHLQGAGAGAGGTHEGPATDSTVAGAKAGLYMHATEEATGRPRSRCCREAGGLPAAGLRSLPCCSTRVAPLPGGARPKLLALRFCLRLCSRHRPTVSALEQRQALPMPRLRLILGKRQDAGRHGRSTRAQRRLVGRVRGQRVVQDVNKSAGKLRQLA